MSKIAETLKEQEEELSKFMIDEYGKWKIGRQEVTDIVNKYSTRIIEAVCEEKAVKIKEWKDKYNSNKFGDNTNYDQGINDGLNQAQSIINENLCSEKKNQNL